MTKTALWTRVAPAAAGLACAAIALAQPYHPEPFGPDPFGPEPQTRVIRTSGMAVGGSFLGVSLQEVDSDRAKALKLKEEAGVEITRVEEDSPAAKAGLKVADVILQYNGQHVEGMEQFSRMVRETPPGREAKLLIVRGGSQHTVIAKIGARKGPMITTIPSMPRIEMPNMPDMPRSLMMWRSAILGIEGEALRGQLAEFFGVKEGVLVRSVMKDTAAERSGIKAGDVILKVNDTRVATPADIGAALRSVHGKTAVPVIVIRDKKEMTLTATIEGDQSGWDTNGPVIRISGPGTRL